MIARAAKVMAMATKTMERKKVMAMAARAARAIAKARRVACNKECDGDSNKEGDGNGVKGGGQVVT